MLTLEMIQDAKKTLDGVARVTPLYESAFINPNANALPEDQVGRAEEIAREFARRLPQVQKLLLEDLDATFESDPAAASREVFTSRAAKDCCSSWQ